MKEQRTKQKQKIRKCPICGRPAVEEFKAFCSKRCTDADLARWLKGAYAIPGRPADAAATDGEEDENSKPH